MKEAFEAFKREDWTEAERLYRAQLADPEQEENAMHMLAFTLAMKKEYGEARTLYEELLHRAEQQGHQEASAIAMHQLAMVCRLEGDAPAAKRWLERERALRREQFPDDHAGHSANAYEFGEVALVEERLEEAIGAFRLALREGKKAEDDICIACAWRGIGQASARFGHDPGPAYEQSMDAFRRAGDAKGEEEVRCLLEQQSG
ncbi:putative ATPase [Bhargavaea cecembensis DSE10]|uniref:Putative ATPase n=1 Tax=Bhargavaea cecembensis DSE10 TaxID=1235279 RepID=M7NIX2_9BACL|nr:tetratricopeptide repeat protein [Bhargavaea cecembensis]EMR07096.1 putative ATPase [Bhargavaea cecembensis DSE10]